MLTYPFSPVHWTPAVLLLTTMACACVPNGPSRPTDGGTGSTAEPLKKPPKPPPTARPANSVAPSPLLTTAFEDKFDRASIGSDWLAAAPGVWEIKEGKLCGHNARNRGIWLLRTLPTNARIEFDAVSSSTEGDLKAEYWGDGRSGATTVSYNNATSYLTIFGGWKNTLHVLARINEHAPDRLQVALSNDAIEEREKPVAAGRNYGFKVERADGKTVSWWVDGVLIHRLEDKQPLLGEGHDHFGFNDWEVGVCFDNVKITPL